MSADPNPVSAPDAAGSSEPARDESANTEPARAEAPAAALARAMQPEPSSPNANTEAITNEELPIRGVCLRYWDHLIGLVLCSSYVAILIRTARNLGYARDEGFYFDAGRSYARWVALALQNWAQARTRAAVDAAWSVNHEHPSLMKTLFGLSWQYLHEKHRVFAEAGTAFRFPGMVMGGLTLWLVYVMGARAYSRRAGIAAALAVALMPRVFYHSHLDCFDVPVMFWWTLVVYCYWRSLEGRSLVWGVLTGLAWGLALDVKFNVFLLPAVFLIHWMVVRGRELGSAARGGGFSVPIAVISMLTLGFATFIALWPWMWFETFVGEGGRPGRLAEYLGFHWNHPYYNIEFFGVNYFRPPFPRSYPYVMIAFTVPAITLVLFLVGLGVRLRPMLRDAAPLAWLIPPIGRLKPIHEFYRPRAGDDPRGTDLLFLGAGYSILALWWKTDTPIFGGTKHWITFYPFLALFAGAGFDATARALERVVDGRVRPAWVPAATLGALCVLSPLVQTAHSHPFGLSSYTPLAGGTPGAADLGMNRQFWGFTTGSLVGFFNDNVPPHGTVFVHDTAWPSWEMLQHDGRVRQDIRAVWGVDADFAIVHHELHMNEVDYQIWQAFQSPETYYVLQHDGVPIISVYRNPRLRERR